MNLQYERIIALHLPIYFERGETEREKENQFIKKIYIPSMMAYAKIRSYGHIAICLDTGGSNSITDSVCAHISIRLITL